MVYEQLGQQLTVDQIMEARRAQLSQFAPSPFQWRSEYLPLIIGAAGFVTIGLILKMKKKRRRK